MPEKNATRNPPSQSAYRTSSKQISRSALPRKLDSEKKKHTACYFQPKGNQDSDKRGKNLPDKLLVPTESMWKLHAASTPPQILERCGISSMRWYEWKRVFGENHWLFDWLQRKANPPEGVKLVYPSTVKVLRRPCRENEFFVSFDMARFRQQSSQAAIAKSVGFSEAIPKHWLKKYADLDWFADWLIRGGESPADWCIATEGEIQRCQTAWNYRAFVRNLSMDLHNGYHRWIRELFPQDQLRVWLGWLYGGPEPDSWFIIPDRLKKLRHRLSVSGISEAADVHIQTYRSWIKHPLQSKAIEDAIKAAADNRSGNPSPPKASRAWNKLFSSDVKWRSQREDMMRKMLRWAEATTLRTALKDLSISGSAWQSYRQSTRSIGGEKLVQELAKYVTGGNIRGSGPFGVIVFGLFAPPEGMLRFREFASSQIARQRLYQVRTVCGRFLWRELGGLCKLGSSIPSFVGSGGVSPRTCC